MGVVGMLMGCGIVSSGEFGTDSSDRRLFVSISTSDIDSPLPFFFRENALLKELLSWNVKNLYHLMENILAEIYFWCLGDCLLKLNHHYNCMCLFQHEQMMSQCIIQNSLCDASRQHQGVKGYNTQIHILDIFIIFVFVLYIYNIIMYPILLFLVLLVAITICGRWLLWGGAAGTRHTIEGRDTSCRMVSY